MDLRTFVAETLKQIVEGVDDAKKHLAAGQTGAKVNAAYGSAHGAPVEFDIAVTVSNQSDDASSTNGKAKAGVISVFQAQVGASLESRSEARSEEVSRVRFTVNLTQPADVTPASPVPPMPTRTAWPR